MIVDIMGNRGGWVIVNISQGKRRKCMRVDDTKVDYLVQMYMDNIGISQRNK